jgi:hypothetical protein
MHMFDPLYYSSDLPSFDPATLEGMVPYYRLMAKVDLVWAIVWYFPGRGCHNRWLDRPVLGVLTSGFPTTAQSSALVCSTRKSVNTLLVTPLGIDLVSTTKFSIVAWEHVAILTRTT